MDYLKDIIKMAKQKEQQNIFIKTEISKVKNTMRKEKQKD